MIKHKDRIDITNEPIIDSVETTVNSSDAIDMVSHGSELIIHLTTPIGVCYRGKTTFIGRHSKNLLLLELPDLPEEDFNFFFQEGFWVEVKAISGKGEGVFIQFRSQIVHILLKPIAMLLISIPGQMRVKQLRQEPRYDVNLKGKILTHSIKLECQVRDLSKSGCRFITSPLAKKFDIGQRLSLYVTTPNKSVVQSLPLMGEICNLQYSVHYAKYGMKFDQSGRTRVLNLLKHMKFDVNKLELKF